MCYISVVAGEVDKPIRGGSGGGPHTTVVLNRGVVICCSVK